jgi:hypothetical protein
MISQRAAKYEDKDMSWTNPNDEYASEKDRSTPVKNTDKSEWVPKNTNTIDVFLWTFVFVFFVGLFIVAARMGSIAGIMGFGLFAVFFGGFWLLSISEYVSEAKENKRREHAMQMNRVQIRILERKLETEEAARKRREQEREIKPYEGRVYDREPPKSKPSFTPPIPEPPKQTPRVPGTPPYKQKVPLKEFAGDNRPRIPIQLRKGNKTIDCDALIDSGASTTIFHGKFAEQLGIDLTTAPVRGFSGIAPDAWIKGYETRIEIGIAGFFIKHLSLSPLT